MENVIFTETITPLTKEVFLMATIENADGGYTVMSKAEYDKRAADDLKALGL